jgi:hypothetical protein
MKISKRQLRRIIREEYHRVLNAKRTKTRRPARSLAEALLLEVSTGNIVKDGISEFESKINQPGEIKGEEKGEPEKLDAIQDHFAEVYDEVHAAAEKVLQSVEDFFNSSEMSGAENGYAPGKIIKLRGISKSSDGSTFYITAIGFVDGKEGQIGLVASEIGVSTKTGEEGHFKPAKIVDSKRGWKDKLAKGVT